MNIIPLSERERAVLSAIWQGKRNKEIGKALCISERTVGNHITQILNKLGTDDRTSACRIGLEHGLIKFAAHQHTVVHYCPECETVLSGPLTGTVQTSEHDSHAPAYVPSVA